MTEEIEAGFFEKYSQLFEPEEIRRDPQRSCMAWGLECGDGWSEILDGLFSDLVATGLDITIEQVKEKYGTLRVYLSGGGDHVWNRVEAAEQESARTCEMCGQLGKLRRNGSWLMTRCNHCMTQ